ncbi:MAG TPA: glycosyltransferase family 39 protein [Acetobacteraceae bacterium]|nr:glycosyltransferase family 39 protein [Acetobacteraceae bacterium]
MQLALVLALGLLLHLGLLATGFERVSNDEAARVLLSLELTPANALEPFVWPPLHRLLIGTALHLHPDPVWVPRIVAIALALGTLLAVLRLARRVSDDPWVLAAAAGLALVTPYRLVLGSVPMADILMLLLAVLAAERVLAWLQGARTSALLAGCALLGLATAVRYEAWFVVATLGLLLAWRWLRGGRVSLPVLAGCGVLLCWFPVFWIANSLLWYGSLANLAVTSEQFRAIAGADAGRAALLLNPMGLPLWQELFWNPATLPGLVMLGLLARHDAALRGYALGFLAAFPLMSLVMFLTGSIALAATWRLVGIWSLLVLPFGALALVRLAGRVAAWLSAPRRALVALALVPALALPAIRDLRLARFGMYNWETESWRHDTQAGRAAVAELGRLGGGRVVVDSLGNLDFLEVMVGSGMPEVFVTSADAPAPEVALYVPMGRHLREVGDAALVERYLADRFGLQEGGEPEALRARDIRVAVVRDPAAKAALDASPRAERVQAWPDWTVYRLRPATVLSGDAR